MKNALKIYKIYTKNTLKICDIYEGIRVIPNKCSICLTNTYLAKNIFQYKIRF